jgi:hypothetical protein
MAKNVQILETGAAEIQHTQTQTLYRVCHPNFNGEGILRDKLRRPIQASRTKEEVYVHHDIDDVPSTIPNTNIAEAKVSPKIKSQSAATRD